MASDISTSSGRSFILSRSFRLDATLVKFRLHRWSLCAYLVILALIAFWPSPVDQPVADGLTELLDFLHRYGIPEWFNYGFVEASANVFLFAPAGILLVLTFPRMHWWKLLAFGVAVSGTIELGQQLFLPHRYASLQDILMNTLGSGAGLLLAALLKRQSSRGGVVNEP